MIQAIYNIGIFVYVIVYTSTGTFESVMVGDSTIQKIIYDSNSIEEDYVRIKKSN